MDAEGLDTGKKVQWWVATCGCTDTPVSSMNFPSTRTSLSAGCDAHACPDAPNGKCAAYVMGTSEYARGPFKYAGTAEPTAASMQHAGGIGDYALLVDIDG